MNKKYSQIVETMLENLSISTLVMEALESTVDSPDEIEQIMDDADAMIDFIKNISRRTFFQALPLTLQSDLTEVINFLSESVREKEYLSSNRLTVPENMIVSPALVTTESVAKMFEIALCRYLIFTSIFFSHVAENHKEDYDELPSERREDIRNILLEIADFEPFIKNQEEYAKISFEEYANVHFTSYEDDLENAEREALGLNVDEVNYASNVVGFGDFDTEGF